MPARLGSRIWLARSHPNFLVSYQGAAVAAIGTGLLSVTADRAAPSPPVLRFYYQQAGIATWGWLFVVAGVVLTVGLFRATFTVCRVGLGLLAGLLSIRLILQVFAAIATWSDHGWKRAAAEAAGLPILYLATSAVFAMTREPPVNPSTARDR